MVRNLLVSGVCLWSACALTIQIHSATIRVAGDVGDDANDGSSWGGAKQTLSGALAVAVAGDEVWVKAGTYRPDRDANGEDEPDDPRTKCFVLKNDVTVYGGFAGDENARDDRDWKENETILSGDVGTRDERSDNCYHVFFHDGEVLNASAKLDGFVVVDGDASGDGIHAYGGAVYNMNCSPSFSNCRFERNRATLYGGAIYNGWNSPARMEDCSFAENAAVLGGAVMNHGVMARAVVTRGVFVGNSATQDGGAVYNMYADAVLTDCVFSWNRADQSAGAVGINQCDAEFVDCVFTGNVARGFAGGAVNVSHASSPRFVDCQFHDNEAKLNGGAVAVSFQSDPPFIRCVFTRNESASRGGAFYCQGIDGDDPDPSFAECRFERNKSNWGGSVYLETCDPTFTDCSFRGNVGGGVGGGVHLDDSDACFIRCAFMRNQANNQGGAIHAKNGSNSNVVNCVFFANGLLAFGRGGAVYNDASSPSILNCSFADNEAKSTGGGVFNANGANPTITNCLFWNNGGEGVEIANDASNPVVANCVVEGGYADGVNVVDENPRLIGPACFGGKLPTLSIPSNSSAVDQGADVEGVVPDEDQRGVERPQGGGVDIGAYENDGDVPPCLDFSIDAIHFGCVVAGKASPAFSCRLFGAGLDQPVTVAVPPSFDVSLDGFSWIAGGGESLTITPDSGLMDVEVLFRFHPLGLGGDTVDQAVVATSSALAAGLTLSGKVSAPFIVRVSPDGDGSDGLSWATAYDDIQTAIESAPCAGAEIWVKTGTYAPTRDKNGNPNPADPRIKCFVMRKGVELYGGFAGDENERNERDATTNPTIIDGDLNGDDADLDGNGYLDDDLIDDNAYILFLNQYVDVDRTAVLDGFILRGGHSINGVPRKCGGGMFNDGTSPTIRNVVFRDNTAETSGGAVYNANGARPLFLECAFERNRVTTANAFGGAMCNDSSDVEVIDCSFVKNRNDWAGGAVYNVECSPLLSGCLFHDNDARSYGGGGVFNDERCETTIVNCTFTDNWTSTFGAAVYNMNCAATITNCTFTGNSANSSGGVYNIRAGRDAVADYAIVNCLFWGNDGHEIENEYGVVVDIRNCLVDGGCPEGENIIDADPKLGPLADNGGPTKTCALGSGSVAFGAGTVVGAPNVDQRGLPRNQARGIDVGAWQGQNVHFVTFSVDDDGNGSIEGPVAQHVVAGNDAVAVTASPGAGRVFVNWTRGDDVFSENNPLVVENVTEDMNLVARFAVQTHRVTFAAADNGSVQGDSPQFVEHGADCVAVTAVPEEGYVFANWTEDGRVVAEDNPLTVVDVSRPMSLIANFRRILTVTFLTDGTVGASVQGESPQHPFPGNDCAAVTAISPAGSRFLKWTRDGEDCGADNPLVVRDVQEDVTFRAHFIRVWNVVFQTDGTSGASLTGDVAQSIDHGGDSTPVTAVAPVGCHFVNWTVDGVVSGDEATCQAIDVVSSLTYKANFAVNRYDVNFITDGTAGATLKGETSQRVAHGSDCAVVTAVAPEGFDFVNWTRSNGTEFSRVAAVVVSGVTGDLTLTANFKKLETVLFAVVFRVSPENGGTLEPNVGTHHLEAETELEAAAVAADGFTFEKWLVEGDLTASATAEPTLALTVKGNGTLTAVFTPVVEECLMTMRTRPAGAGTTNPVAGSAMKLEKGAKIAIQATPMDGYVFAGWSANPAANASFDDAGSEVTDVQLFDAAAVTAVFAEAEVEREVVMKAYPSDGGTTTPETGGSVMVDGGGRLEITATANDGFAFVEWLASPAGNVVFDDASAVSCEATVSGDVVLTAKFEPITASLTFTVSPENSGSVSLSDGLYEVIGSHDVEAIPAAGHQFSRWLVSGAASVADATCAETTLTLNGDAELVACFKRTPDEEVELELTMLASPGDGGATLPAVANNPTLVPGDEPVTVRAIPNTEAGYVFSGWTLEGNGAVGDPAATETTVIIHAAATLTAHFALDEEGEEEPLSVAMKVFPEESGEVVLDADGVIGYGSVVRICASVADGFDFSHWTCEGNGTIADVNSPETQLRVNGNLTVTAVFLEASDSLRLTMIVGEGGSIEPRGVLSVTPDDRIVVKATADEGFFFRGWIVSEGDVNCSRPHAPVTVLSVQSDATVIADFALETESDEFDGESFRVELMIRDDRRNADQVRIRNAPLSDLITLGATREEGGDAPQVFIAGVEFDFAGAEMVVFPRGVRYQTENAVLTLDDSKRVWALRTWNRDLSTLQGGGAVDVQLIYDDLVSGANFDLDNKTCLKINTKAKTGFGVSRAVVRFNTARKNGDKLIVRRGQWPVGESLIPGRSIKLTICGKLFILPGDAFDHDRADRGLFRFPAREARGQYPGLRMSVDAMRGVWSFKAAATSLSDMEVDDDFSIHLIHGDTEFSASVPASEVLLRRRLSR